jgi:homocysteine S-methyltransferase
VLVLSFPMAPILILDGGLGTSLERQYGVKFDHSRPLWSSDLLVSDPGTLLACQADFGRRVPVDILLTATYQVSAEGFAKTPRPSTGDADATANADSDASVHALARAGESLVAAGDGGRPARLSNANDSSIMGIPRPSIPHYIETAVQLAEKAKLAHAAVALSVGPYGACMVPSQEYSGAYDDAHSTLDGLTSWHADRLHLFAAAVCSPDSPSAATTAPGLRFVAVETIPRVDEILALRVALARAHPGLASLPFWISCLFPGHAETLPDGSSVDAAVDAMLLPRPDAAMPWAIGINCTKVDKLDALLRRYEAAVARLLRERHIQAWPALVLYPDGTNGEVYNTETQQWDATPSDSSPHERRAWHLQLADLVRHTEARGHWAQIVVGGCCMASYHDIYKLRETLASQPFPSSPPPIQSTL